MGKYRARLSLPNHLFGTVKVYDDDDPVTLHWVSTGMLVREDVPPAKRSVKKAAAKKRAAKKVAPVAADPEPVAEPEPEVEPQPEVEVERPSSSVQTSWRISD